MGPNTWVLNVGLILSPDRFDVSVRNQVYDMEHLLPLYSRFAADSSFDYLLCLYKVNRTKRHCASLLMSHVVCLTGIQRTYEPRVHRALPQSLWGAHLLHHCDGIA